jgi:hypothetical protein
MIALVSLTPDVATSGVTHSRRLRLAAGYARLLAFRLFREGAGRPDRLFVGVHHRHSHSLVSLAGGRPTRAAHRSGGVRSQFVAQKVPASNLGGVRIDVMRATP